MNLDKISFDDSDKNLFQVDDARLRADALKHSILPRLHVVISECIATIKKVYNIEVLEDSTVSYFPHFRQKRPRELEHLYEHAYVSLGGKRTKNKWHGVQRKDQKPVQILPFRLGISLSEEGLSFVLENYWLKGLTDESFKKFFQFHLKFEGLIHRLCYSCGMCPILFYGDEIEPIATFREHYEYMIENGLFDNSFMSVNPRGYPIPPTELELIIQNYVLFYPVYDSYIQIAKGEQIRFEDLIKKANQWLRAMEEYPEETHKAPKMVSEEAKLQAKKAAEQRTRVMPAIRWQVFQRDNWKCVSCGRSSANDAILHVDHILPRSKGGKDEIDNFQTLCQICNIGKSNKDDTNIRDLNNVEPLMTKRLTEA